MYKRFILREIKKKIIGCDAIVSFTSDNGVYELLRRSLCVYRKTLAPFINVYKPSKGPLCLIKQEEKTVTQQDRAVFQNADQMS